MRNSLALVPRPDIILFSTADWDNPYRTNKQIVAEQFARRGYRVLYIDSLGLRRPVLHSRDMRRMAKRVLKAMRPCRKVMENLWVASPLCLPGAKTSFSRQFNSFLLLCQINFHLKYLGMERPLIWTYNPAITSLLKKIPCRGIVYHCVDNLEASPGINSETIRQGERELAKIASLCFVTSPLLKQKLEQFFNRVVYEPNGCDNAFFETAYLIGVPVPFLNNIPHPRLLFVGALSEYKVDFGLLKKIGQKRPDWQWILIGQQGEGQPLSGGVPDLPNMHVAGGCLHGQLPYIISQCDVAVMPIPHNDYTDYMFPMKFFEFLSARIPVVCTRLPSLADFEELYSPCETENDFEMAIEKALKTGIQNADQIQEACARNSFDMRFMRMENALQKFVLQNGA